MLPNMPEGKVEQEQLRFGMELTITPIRASQKNIQFFCLLYGTDPFKMGHIFLAISKDDFVQVVHTTRIKGSIQQMT